MQTRRFGLNNFGYICKPASHNIAQAIELFYQNSSLCKQIALNCRQRAQDFTWNKLIHKLIDIYKM